MIDSRLCILFLALSSTCLAAPLPVQSLPLEQAVREARDHSPEYQRAQSAAEGASWKKVEGLSAYLPHVSLTGQHFFYSQFELMGLNFGGQSLKFPAEYPMSTLTLEASLTVFDGFRGWNNYQAGVLEGTAARQQLARADFQLSADVRSRFYQALAAQFLADVAARNIQTLEEHLSDARARETTGFATRFDVLRIEVQLEEARTDKLGADDQVTISRMRLAQTMGEENDQRVLDGTLPVPTPAMVPENLTLDIQDRPDLQALQNQEAAAEKAYAASKSHWYPSVSFFGNVQGYGFVGDHSIGTLDSTGTASAVGVNLTWTLFDGLAPLARQKQADAHADEARHGLDATLLQAATDFKTRKLRYAHGLSEYQARLRAVSKAEESVRLATIGQKAGVRTNMERLDAELDLMKTRAGVIRSQAETIDTLISLELAAGKRLF